jgi:hypothetical protein
MNLATFIIPLDATTQQFSGFWKQGGNEQVYSIPKAVEISLDDLSRALNDEVHVKTVQRIRQEEIFVGSLFATPFIRPRYIGAQRR